MNEAGVADDRLEDHARDGVGVLGEQGLNGFEVVVRRREGVGRGAARDTGGVGQAECGHTGTGFHQEHVRMAVVAALELDHLVAAGVGTDQAQHSHAGLGAAVDEAHHLNAGDSVDHHFGQGVFQGTRCSEAGALLDRFLQCCDHLGVGVAADGRSPAADVVDVLIAIHVPGIGTLHPIEHDRLTANRLERPHRGADTSGHQGLCCAEDGLGVAGVQRGSCHWNRRQRADANRATS